MAKWTTPSEPIGETATISADETAIEEKIPALPGINETAGLAITHGKRLMLTSQERNAVEFLSFFAKNGIDSTKLSYVDHNFDPMATVNGQADVMSAYITNQPFILQQKGIPYNILDPAAYA